MSTEGINQGNLDKILSLWQGYASNEFDIILNSKSFFHFYHIYRDWIVSGVYNISCFFLIPKSIKLILDSCSDFQLFKRIQIFLT